MDSIGSLYARFWQAGASSVNVGRPILRACVHPQEGVGGDEVPQILGHPLKGLIENDQF